MYDPRLSGISHEKSGTAIKTLTGFADSEEKLVFVKRQINCWMHGQRS